VSTALRRMQGDGGENEHDPHSEGPTNLREPLRCMLWSTASRRRRCHEALQVGTAACRKAQLGVMPNL
jgi:hypothetical protein